MPASETTVEPLIALPREQYLMKTETRLRSLASNALASGNPDPEITKWLNAVQYAEDLQDIHEIAEAKYRTCGPRHHAEMHRNWSAQSKQLKLLALDQLAHLLI